MTEILDLTPAMDLDTELTNGMDNNDDRHPMENEPPFPQDDSRPGTPHLTNCEQMKILARNIKYCTITIENIKANIRSLKLHGLNDEDCHIMKEHLQRLDNYTALNTNAERPIKVVINGLPKKAKPEDIEKDLIDLGFTVDRVSQLIGKITNQPLPVFLVSLPET
ncbi:hypothetical protein TNCV_4889991 [Trichonephila clavipes]|nr:hypothetical protein TNCV_4889991 [Trichonephila clavipes]